MINYDPQIFCIGHLVNTMIINFVLRAQWRVDVSDDQVFAFI